MNAPPPRTTPEPGPLWPLILMAGILVWTALPYSTQRRAVRRTKRAVRALRGKRARR